MSIRAGETLSDSIRRLRHEGYPQRQAVAIAHREHGITQPRVKGNPELAIVGTNPPEGLLSRDVLAIVYRHAEEDGGTIRVHLFGGSGDFRENKDGSLTLWPADMSGVQMRASTDLRQLVLSHSRGLPLSAEYL